MGCTTIVGRRKERRDGRWEGGGGQNWSVPCTPTLPWRLNTLVSLRQPEYEARVDSKESEVYCVHSQVVVSVYDIVTEP